MKSKLLYCLSLIGILFILSFTVIKKQAKNGCLIACNKVEESAANVQESTDFIIVDALTKYLVFSITR